MNKDQDVTNNNNVYVNVYFNHVEKLSDPICLDL